MLYTLQNQAFLLFLKTVLRILKPSSSDSCSALMFSIGREFTIDVRKRRAEVNTQGHQNTVANAVLETLDFMYIVRPPQRIRPVLAVVVLLFVSRCTFGNGDGPVARNGICYADANKYHVQYLDGSCFKGVEYIYIYTYIYLYHYYFIYIITVYIYKMILHYIVHIVYTYIYIYIYIYI